MGAKAQEFLASYLNKVLQLVSQQNDDARYKEVGYYALALAISKMGDDSPLAEQVENLLQSFGTADLESPNGMIKLRVIQAYQALGKHGFKFESHLKSVIDLIYR